jgi:hypothetical protein
VRSTSSTIWRLVLLLPVPYLAFLAAIEGRILDVVPAGIVPGDASVRTLVKPVVLFLAAALAAALLWARKAAPRLLGSVAYAMALATAFALGLLRAMISAEGGLHGEPRGPIWLTAVLGAGALMSALGILPLVALVVADLREPR